MRTYSQNRDRIAEYFDKTGFRAWEALTTETPVSKIRLKVRASREKMRSRMLLHLPNDLSGKRILDAGCGTGYVAETLIDLNYKNLVGIDYSKDMLEIARSKKIYKKLICQSLSKKTSMKSAQFDLVICTGVLTSGHVGPSAIRELLRVTKPKGYLILSISETIFTKLKFKDELEKRDSEYQYVHLTKPFIALPNHNDSARSRMHTLQKN